MDAERANYILGKAIAGFQDYEIEDLASTMRVGSGGLERSSEIEVLGEAAASGDKVPIQCVECDHRFKRKLGSRVTEARCPKCGSYDTEVV